MAVKVNLPGGRCKPPITRMIWKTRRGTLDLTRQAQVMGILNVTPDSFSDGGRHADPTAALIHARQMIAEGATLIDIGGESTRPGAHPVSATDEIARTLPIIAALRAEWDGLISIDTSKAAVAAAALAAGADIVNDVSGLRADPEMPGICIAHACGVVLMHRQGNPQTMQTAPHYQNVVAEVRSFFTERMESLVMAGMHPAALCFDPGIGFGKSLEHNLSLLRALDQISPPGHPLLLGVSRKSFLSQLVGSNDLSRRNAPTIAITARARAQGIMLHRVHEVLPNIDALRVTEALIEPLPQP
jgi:dihydropteroate synthase